MGESWKGRYFEEGYLRRWTLGPPGESEGRTAAALLALVGRSPPLRVLDAGCGHGRLSKPLADVGNFVVGLDASWALLSRAVRQSTTSPGRVSWVRGDMEALPFRRCFDLIVVKDAFGYFAAEGHDLQFLRGASSVLEPGGHLILQNPNARWIRSNWKDQLHEGRDGQTVFIANRLDRTGRWLEQDLEIVDAAGEHRFHRRQRLYDSSELTALVTSAGFDRVSHFSDLQGAPFAELTSSHVVTVCRRSGDFE